MRHQSLDLVPLKLSAQLVLQASDTLHAFLRLPTHLSFPLYHRPCQQTRVLKKPIFLARVRKMCCKPQQQPLSMLRRQNLHPDLSVPRRSYSTGALLQPVAWISTLSTLLLGIKLCQPCRMNNRELFLVVLRQVFRHRIHDVLALLLMSSEPLLLLGKWRLKEHMSARTWSQRV